MEEEEEGLLPRSSRCFSRADVALLGLTVVIRLIDAAHSVYSKLCMLKGVLLPTETSQPENNAVFSVTAFDVDLDDFTIHSFDITTTFRRRWAFHFFRKGTVMDLSNMLNGNIRVQQEPTKARFVVIQYQWSEGVEASAVLRSNAVVTYPLRRNFTRNTVRDVNTATMLCGDKSLDVTNQAYSIFGSHGSLPIHRLEAETVALDDRYYLAWVYLVAICGKDFGNTGIRERVVRLNFTDGSVVHMGLHCEICHDKTGATHHCSKHFAVW